tara:strand:- start:888 stop:1184 length:297 start_codon:yes stop_codon:yes gene_type:complete
MRISKKNIPSTVDAAARQLIDSLSKAELGEFRDAEDYQLHFGIGLTIRNNWNLFESASPLWRDAFDHHGTIDADSISSLIIEKAQEIIRGERGDLSNR